MSGSSVDIRGSENFMVGSSRREMAGIKDVKPLLFLVCLGFLNLSIFSKDAICV